MLNNFVELQCDALVGPSHNYAGLSFGNVASATNAKSVAYPKKAALQGLEKMRFIASLGIPQLILPPPPRPHLPLLEQLGFRGSLQEMLALAGETDPVILASAWSASSMWAANMATVTPAVDANDGKLHLTPANLASTLHRQQEADYSYQLLRKVFRNIAEVHTPLPACLPMTDEGAANHMRLAAAHGATGVEVFIYGKSARIPSHQQPRRYPARQTREASEAVARLHRLSPERTVFARQHPEAIDAGVFHNDVIAMSNGNLLIYHEKAFDGEAGLIHEIREKLAPTPLIAYMIPEAELSLEEAVKSYLFNSQLLSLPNGEMVIVAPAECEEMPSVKRVLDKLCAKPEIPVARYFCLDLRESMKNGGGPACLRLRVALERSALLQLSQWLWSPTLHEKLGKWIESHYPEEITSTQLRDAGFAKEILRLQKELAGLLGLAL